MRISRLRSNTYKASICRRPARPEWTAPSRTRVRVRRGGQGAIREPIRVRRKPHPSAWTAPIPTGILERVGRKLLFCDQRAASTHQLGLHLGHVDVAAPGVSRVELAGAAVAGPNEYSRYPCDVRLNSCPSIYVPQSILVGGVDGALKLLSFARYSPGAKTTTVLKSRMKWVWSK